MDHLLSGLGKRQFLLHNVHEQDPTIFETRWTMAYLRGPLGRDEIKTLAAPGTVTLARTKLVEPSGSRGTAGTGAGAPVLDPAIQQLFVPSATAYVPMLLGVAKIAYSDAKLGLDETKTVSVVTPITDGPVGVDWERAELADFTVEYLLKAAPVGATFADVPAAAAKPKNYAAWEKDFSQWLGQSQSIELLKSSRAKVLSNPDESERDFRIRLQGEAREARDAALAKVRDKYASKMTNLQDRIRRAEQAVQVQSEQATGAKMGAAVSIGATIFGALLGRKAVSASTLGRATTAARGMGRISKEAQDVARATENVGALTTQLSGLETDMQNDLQAVSSDWDLSNEPFERVLVKPKRGGVSVQLVSLVWVPA
jgi:hypothetical protein